MNVNELYINLQLFTGSCHAAKKKINNWKRESNGRGNIMGWKIMFNYKERPPVEQHFRRTKAKGNSKVLIFSDRTVTSTK